MATRDDVARLAGVSSSTVSYVISGRRPISADTQAKVRAAMRELNYTPNAFARGLAGARRGVIALHYPHSPQGVSSTEFEYVSAAAEKAQGLGYHLLLWTQPLSDTEGLRSLVDQGMVDGVILMEVTPDDPRIAPMRDSGTPFVLVGTPDAADIPTYVDNDYADQADQAVAHLAARGCGDFVFLGPDGTSDSRGFGPSLRIRRELERAALEHGVSCAVHLTPATPLAGRTALHAIRAQHTAPLAVVSFNELAVAGMLYEAALIGLAVPRDLMVLALNMGSNAAELAQPPVTTLSPEPHQIMSQAVKALVSTTSTGLSEAPRVQLLVRSRLTLRATT
ncbi:LacI family DNA-binding transcriptional regulator [Populibacterium corticicola]|uniref:LacI family DNA-binding transcriptional regulator n=1 Tax=Populibacterium corticicola TaxID=1812826 RepID=A0ABW5XGZ1_9MICO